jgi:quercetin dioxygenase-like cupin family protein
MTTPDPPRPHAHERLAAPVAKVVLADAADALRAEHGTGGHGHRQVVLYRHGDTTVALFQFDAGAGLREHEAAGTVLIQVVEGELDVRAAERAHRLGAGHILAMAPGVRHDVKALAPSLMLLTVCLERPPAGKSG